MGEKEGFGTIKFLNVFLFFCNDVFVMTLGLLKMIQTVRNVDQSLREPTLSREDRRADRCQRGHGTLCMRKSDDNPQALVSRRATRSKAGGNPQAAAAAPHFINPLPEAARAAALRGRSASRLRLRASGVNAR